MRARERVARGAPLRVTRWSGRTRPNTPAAADAAGAGRGD